MDATANEMFYKHARQVCEQVQDKLRCKRQDYGRDNILKHGVYGVLVRMDDKFERARNLIRPGAMPQVTNESVVDTFHDVIGYSIIALALLEDKW